LWRRGVSAEKGFYPIAEWPEEKDKEEEEENHCACESECSCCSELRHPFLWWRQISNATEEQKTKSVMDLFQFQAD
jgi:hypothetical protein